MSATDHLQDGERIVSNDAVDHHPYWLATTGRLHRVTGVTLVWRGPNATFGRPRIHINIACRSLFAPKYSGLALQRIGRPCPKCFKASA